MNIGSKNLPNGFRLPALNTGDYKMFFQLWMSFTVSFNHPWLSDYLEKQVSSPTSSNKQMFSALGFKFYIFPFYFSVIILDSCSDLVLI